MRYTIEGWARALGLSLSGWDEVRGELKRADGTVALLGTHREICEYLKIDERTKTALRERIEERAAELDFEVVSWLDESAEIHGHERYFYGLHHEVLIYLDAWKACALEAALGSKTRDRADGKPLHGVEHAIMALHSSVPILPDQEAQITIRPQSTAFRGHRIAIPDDIAPFFRILDLKVGNRSQLSNGDGIRASMFATRIDRQAAFTATIVRGDTFKLSLTEDAKCAFGRVITMDTCQTAMDLVMIVKMIGYHEQGLPFEAFVLGVQASRYGRG